MVEVALSMFGRKIFACSPLSTLMRSRELHGARRRLVRGGPLAALGLLLASAQHLACTAELGSPGSTADSPTASAGGGGSPSSGGSSVGGAPQSNDCTSPAPPSAPLRRLTRFEYNNTVRDLAKVTDAPANNFPPEEIGSGFGTDADAQTVSEVLAEKYLSTAAKIAASLTSAERIAELAPCAASVTAATEASCARSVIDAFVPLAYRRPLEAGEADGLVQLFQTVRTAGSTFASSLAAVIEAVLQSPEFLYRPELGVPVEGRPEWRRPRGHEMAARLSYLFWGSMPDEPLRSAAASGGLDTPEQVRAQAARLLEDPRARDVVRFFFDGLLPIQGLSNLMRTEFPQFNGKIGSLMRQETQTFLENLVFGGGSWPEAFTAPYSYMNQELAEFYGISGVTGSAFQKVPLDGVKRAGLMTQGGVVAGPIHSNETNPVVRGSFVLNKLLCVKIAIPPASLGPIVPPEVTEGGTARDRYTAHSANAQCDGCHRLLDPIGFSLENFNAVGQWQDQENGKTIDVAVDSPQLGALKGAVELGSKIAQSPEAQACFVANWANFAYGRGTDEQEACSMQRVEQRFRSSGYNIKELLLELTQTDTFLYLPAVRP